MTELRGLLTEGVLVSSVFIDKGTIVTTRGRSVPARTRKAEAGAISPKVPLVVLVDQGTASASDIHPGQRDRARTGPTRRRLPAPPATP